MGLVSTGKLCSACAVFCDEHRHIVRHDILRAESVLADKVELQAYIVLQVVAHFLDCLWGSLNADLFADGFVEKMIGNLSVPFAILTGKIGLQVLRQTRSWSSWTIRWRDVIYILFIRVGHPGSDNNEV